MGGNMPDMGNQIPILAAKNSKLAAFIFKLMDHCSKTCNISCVGSVTVLQFQHQWEQEQKGPDDTKAPKLDKNNWGKLWRTYFCMWSGTMSR